MKVLQVLQMYCFLQFCTSLSFCLQTLAAGKMNCERKSFKLSKIVNFGRFWKKISLISITLPLKIMSDIFLLFCLFLPFLKLGKMFDVLHDLLAFVQFKNVKNTHGGLVLFVKLQVFNLQLTLLKVTVLHGCFSRFLTCTIGTKLRKTLHMFYFISKDFSVCEILRF